MVPYRPDTMEYDVLVPDIRRIHDLINGSDGTKKNLQERMTILRKVLPKADDSALRMIATGMRTVPFSGTREEVLRYFYARLQPNTDLLDFIDEQRREHANAIDRQEAALLAARDWVPRFGTQTSNYPGALALLGQVMPAAVGVTLDFGSFVGPGTDEAFSLQVLLEGKDAYTVHGYFTPSTGPGSGISAGLTPNATFFSGQARDFDANTFKAGSPKELTYSGSLLSFQGSYSWTQHGSLVSVGVTIPFFGIQTIGTKAWSVTVGPTGKVF